MFLVRFKTLKQVGVNEWDSVIEQKLFPGSSTLDEIKAWCIENDPMITSFMNPIELSEPKPPKKDTIPTPVYSHDAF